MATETTRRGVSVERVSAGRFEAVNSRGGRISFGTGGTDEFTPTELLLAAIGGCTAIDIDIITTRRAEPESFEIVVDAGKVRDANGNRLVDIVTTYRVAFPPGSAGDAARAVLPDAVEQSRQRLCTVGRTVEIGTPIRATIE